MTLSYARYSRPFHKPLNYGIYKLDSRSGLILKWENDGSTFYAEASPLESHSKETLEDVLSVLNSVDAKNLLNLFEDEGTPASLCFALEALSLECREPIFLNSVATNALLTMALLPELLASASALAGAGYGTIKLKISPDTISPLNELLLADVGIKWRLDANQSFNQDQLSGLFDSISGEAWKNVEYLEEPLSDWSDPILKNAPVELAVDESVREKNSAISLVEKLGSAPIFILKPTVWGGFGKVEEFASMVGWERIVVTSNLESEIGRRSILRWLASGIPMQRAAGLSNGSLWRENHMEDQAVFSHIPPPCALEEKWLASLAWNVVP